MDGFLPQPSLAESFFRRDAIIELLCDTTILWYCSFEYSSADCRLWCSSVPVYFDSMCIGIGQVLNCDSACILPVEGKAVSV